MSAPGRGAAVRERAVEIAPGHDGRRVVRAPALGRWSGIPREGALLRAGDAVGRLHRLHTAEVLRLPDGAEGRVTRLLSLDRECAVEYGQVLFELAPLRLDGGAVDAAGPGSAAEGASAGPTIDSPTDGVFYRRATPDEPPFVEVGATIHRGQPVGLVEVMKTFNRIVYDGADLPERAVVEEILVDDAVEVAAGQPLVRLRRV